MLRFVSNRTTNEPLRKAFAGVHACVSMLSIRSWTYSYVQLSGEKIGTAIVSRKSGMTCHASRMYLATGTQEVKCWCIGLIKRVLCLVTPEVSEQGSSEVVEPCIYAAIFKVGFGHLIEVEMGSEVLMII